MGSRPTILVAGGLDLLLSLKKYFHSSLCNVIAAESVMDALDLSVDASIIVVDEALPGGSDELCRLLRADGTTHALPIILAVNGERERSSSPANARVEKRDTRKLVRTMVQLCPGLSPSARNDDPESPGNEAPLEDEPTIAMTDRASPPPRRPSPSSELSSWPPPPPHLGSGKTPETLAQDFIKHITILLEGLADTSRLTPVGLAQLKESARLTVEEVDAFLSPLQSTINEALKSKDLDRMRLLSVAKSSLYEKLQQLRLLWSKVAQTSPPPLPAAPDATAPAAMSEITPGVARPPAAPVRLRSASTPATGAKETVEPPKPKSALTQAAEAKEAAAQTSQRTAAPPSRAPFLRPRPGGTARKEGTSQPGWLVVSISLLVMIIAGALGYSFFWDQKKPQLSASPTVKGNAPPVMKVVVLEQTRAGILVRPRAEDPNEDRVAFRIRWLLNRNEVRGAITARLPPSSYKVGDTVQAEVIPNDGRSAGLPMISRELVVAPLTSTPPAKSQPR